MNLIIFASHSTFAVVVANFFFSLSFPKALALFTRFDINYARNIECCASYVPFIVEYFDCTLIITDASTTIIITTVAVCCRYFCRQLPHTCKFNEYIK